MTEAQQLEQQADRAAAAGQYGMAKSLLEQAVGGGGSSFELWHKLSAMRKASGDPRGALMAIDQALTFSPLDFSALLFRATLLEKVDDPRAGREFGHALAQCPPYDQIPPSMKPG